MSACMAIDVDSHRKAGNVTRHHLDMNCQGRNSSAKSLGADPELVDCSNQLVFHLAKFRVSVNFKALPGALPGDAVPEAPASDRTAGPSLP